MRITLLPAAVYGFVLLLVIAIIAQSTSTTAFCADQKWHRTILKLLHERHVNRAVTPVAAASLVEAQPPARFVPLDFTKRIMVLHFVLSVT
jgi:nitrate/TMAO reductase-like tetraheme cytochrome c subunit